MKKIRLPLPALLLLCLAAPSQAFELTILHTNDVHAMYGGTTENGTACYAARCPGGAGGGVRLKQAVDTVRAAKPNVVLLDAGDEFQGTLFYTQFKGDVAAEMLDALGYTAFTPGNHEFDDGCGEFRRFAERTRVPVLAANLTLPPVSGGRPLTRPWIVVERQGRKIGIVGLANEETPSLASPCKEARFSPAETALREAAASLRAQGVDIIIALTHLGLDADCALAERVEDVDVFVGGHTHSLLSNTDPKAAGPYPIVKRSPSGEPVLIVTAASSCKLLGHITVDFNDAGVARRWSGEPIVLDGRNVAVPPDAELSARLEGYAARLRSLIGQPVGKILLAGDTGGRQVDLEEDARLCRVQECLSGDVLVDSLLWGARDSGASIALSVGGSVRSPLHTGVVTMGDLLTAMPFDNTLVVGDLTGKQLAEALEHGASGYESGAGRFLQVAGLTYSVEPAKPAGQRVSAVSVRTKAGCWEPLRPEAVYRVVTVDYVAEGGDGFAAFKKIRWQYTGRAHSECLRDYIAKAPVEVGPGGRIQVLR
ncbi:MAG: bifunctional metallophosphatase/5'-nucleotidase [Bilophila sp.]|nr:bifunctional metallophosphatase/5'-nucleotidase [Bilophila sp.]